MYRCNGPPVLHTFTSRREFSHETTKCIVSFPIADKTSSPSHNCVLRLLYSFVRATNQAMRYLEYRLAMRHSRRRSQLQVPGIILSSGMPQSRRIQLLYRGGISLSALPVYDLVSAGLRRTVHLTNGQMKKRLLMLFLIALMIAAGIIAGPTRANRYQRRTSWPAVMIVLRQTEYGLDGEVLRSVKIIRQQHNDGTWEEDVGNRGNGKSQRSTGQVDVSQVPTVQEYERAAAETGRPEAQLLGYRVFIQKDAREEFWYAPELDAVLKAVRYNDDGSVSFVIEAVSVTPR
jgi:hypothetical protein